MEVILVHYGFNYFDELSSFSSFFSMRWVLIISKVSLIGMFVYRFFMSNEAIFISSVIFIPFQVSFRWGEFWLFLKFLWLVCLCIEFLCQMRPFLFLPFNHPRALVLLWLDVSFLLFFFLLSHIFLTLFLLHSVSQSKVLQVTSCS